MLLKWRTVSYFLVAPKLRWPSVGNGDELLVQPKMIYYTAQSPLAKRNNCVCDELTTPYWRVVTLK